MPDNVESICKKVISLVAVEENNHRYSEHNNNTMSVVCAHFSYMSIQMDTCMFLYHSHLILLDINICVCAIFVTLVDNTSCQPLPQQ